MFVSLCICFCLWSCIVALCVCILNYFTHIHRREYKYEYAIHISFHMTCISWTYSTHSHNHIYTASQSLHLLSDIYMLSFRICIFVCDHVLLCVVCVFAIELLHTYIIYEYKYQYAIHISFHIYYVIVNIFNAFPPQKSDTFTNRRVNFTFMYSWCETFTLIHSVSRILCGIHKLQFALLCCVQCYIALSQCVVFVLHHHLLLRLVVSYVVFTFGICFLCVSIIVSHTIGISWKWIAAHKCFIIYIISYIYNVEVLLNSTTHVFPLHVMRSQHTLLYILPNDIFFHITHLGTKQMLLSISLCKPQTRTLVSFVSCFSI